MASNEDSYGGNGGTNEIGTDASPTTKNTIATTCNNQDRISGHGDYVDLDVNRILVSAEDDDDELDP